MKKENLSVQAVKENLFPPSVFFVYLIVLLLMSGIHTGLIVAMAEWGWSKISMTIVPIMYWTLVAVGLTLFTRVRIRKIYEEPMHQLARAAASVASGDFSVYVPTVHTEDKFDYIDVMIQNFNKMVEELGSIETLRTDFFSNVSHEIKTPIAVIQNTAELLQSKTLSDDKRQEHAASIITSSKRLSSLITNILKLNKLEKQTIAPVPESFDFCEHLVQCILLFEPVWEEKKIEFVVNMEDETKMIYCDADLLSLVWNNLLSNAFKFTNEGGTVTLSQHTEGNNVIVEIADTGCGMTEETKKHIFDKFYQGDTSHSTEGNGLGLSLALRVIQLMNGNIYVDSTVGRGTTFTVKLPVRRQMEDTL